MNKFIIQKEIARLIVLQRIELIDSKMKKIRKVFGRKFFSSFITKYFLNTALIGKKYFDVMEKEFFTLKNFIEIKDKNFLSIGGGVGGLELFINNKVDNSFFCFVEKNYVTKKVKYGWDEKNLEAYNNIELQKKFLLKNGMETSSFKIFDCDKDVLPENKFDVIISLLSLDYHYDFNIYIEYLKKVSHMETKIIFDTIRAEYFSKIFKNFEIIQSQDQTVHKSKRIVCSEFI